MNNKLTPQEYQDFFSKLGKSQKNALYLADMEEATKLNKALESIADKNSALVQALIFGTEIFYKDRKEIISKQEKPVKIEKEALKKEISVKDIRLDSLDNFENFFQSEFGVKELKDLGIEINIQEKTIDLTGIKSPQFLYLGKTHASVAFARLYKLIGVDLLQDVKVKKGGNHIYGKSEAKKVLDAFFKMLGYEVITGEIKPNVRLDSLNDYMVFFESEIGLQQLKDFGAIINSKNKTFDLSNIKRPQSYRLGDLSSSVAIFKIRDLLNKDNLEIEKTSGAKQVFKISVAQEILKVFFEKMGYKNLNRKKKEVSEEEAPTIPNIQEEVKKVVQTLPKKQEVPRKKFYVDGKTNNVLTSTEARDRIFF